MTLREDLETMVSVCEADQCPDEAATVQAAIDRIAKLEAENARLREALEPFAKVTEKIEAFVEDRVNDGGSTILKMSDFRLADFHRAVLALEPKDA